MITRTARHRVRSIDPSVETALAAAARVASAGDGISVEVVLPRRAGVVTHAREVARQARVSATTEITTDGISVRFVRA
jgi:hypothetical protein